MKKQIPAAALIVPALLIVAAVGYFLLVKPKQDASGRLDAEIAELQSQVDTAYAARHEPAGGDETTIKAADLFRLTKAMPDDDDMPGIILELNSVASEAGVSFVSIAPSAAVAETGYSSIPISLTFAGNYYDLTDFLFRLRNLVIVRDGKLDADGRLFTLDALDMHEGPNGFPEIEATLTLSAYVYTPAPADAASAPGDATTTTTPSPPADSQALGGTP